MSEVATLPSSQRRLGRGLSALLGGGAPASSESDPELTAELAQLPTSCISRSPFQPRKQFDPESLGELTASIREHGILQPLLVREVEEGYQLVAGERRWQAAQKAGLTSVPCRIVDVIDKTACEFALEENLKRKDLNDLEKAQAFRDYLDQFECTIEELSKQLSMNRSTVNNMLRLLDLSDPVKKALHSGRISAGHARALLPLPEAEQLELCGTIQAEQYSVRQTEATVKRMLGREVPPESSPVTEGSPSAPSAETETTPAPQGENAANEAEASSTGQATSTDADQENPETLPISEAESGRTHHVESLEQQLRDMLGVPVQIRLNSKDAGQIVVPFSNNAEFERILATLRRSAA